MLLVYIPRVCRYDHQIRHNKLPIQPLKNEFSTFLYNEIYFSNLFCIFLKNRFSCKAFGCDTYEHPLTLSDRAEIFTTDTSKYPLEVESTVLISHDPIRIYTVLIPRKPGLARTFTYFFKKKEKVRFSKKLKTTSEI
jgi:hypothetical protein